MPGVFRPIFPLPGSDRSSSAGITGCLPSAPIAMVRVFCGNHWALCRGAARSSYTLSGGAQGFFEPPHVRFDGVRCFDLASPRNPEAPSQAEVGLQG